jgi:hypothetical protein
LYKIVFFGDTIKSIGTDDSCVKLGQDYKRGRMEQYVIPEGEELLGCEIHYHKKRLFGVRWLSWRNMFREPKEMTKIPKSETFKSFPMKKINNIDS